MSALAAYISVILPPLPHLFQNFFVRYKLHARRNSVIWGTPKCLIDWGKRIFLLRDSSHNKRGIIVIGSQQYILCVDLLVQDKNTPFPCTATKFGNCYFTVLSYHALYYPQSKRFCSKIIKAVNC